MGTGSQQICSYSHPFRCKGNLHKMEICGGTLKRWQNIVRASFGNRCEISVLEHHAEPRKNYGRWNICFSWISGSIFSSPQNLEISTKSPRWMLSISVVRVRSDKVLPFFHSIDHTVRANITADSPTHSLHEISTIPSAMVSPLNVEISTKNPKIEKMEIAENNFFSQLHYVSKC